jgi:hypothetical protein
MFLLQTVVHFIGFDWSGAGSVPRGLLAYYTKGP